MYYYIFNIGVLLLFLLVTGVILYYCNKYKMTEKQKTEKQKLEHEYILSKIRRFQEEAILNRESQYTGITNLPFIDMSPKT